MHEPRWNLGEMQREFAQKELPPPDKGMARERCLREVVDALDLAP